MSYIRCLSNPEGLYIWSDGKDVHISGKKIKREITIPEKVFEGLIRKFQRNFWKDSTYQGASIKEVFVANKRKPNRAQKLLKLKPGRFQMRLAYKKRRVDLWLVSWAYICQNVIRR